MVTVRVLPVPQVRSTRGSIDCRASDGRDIFGRLAQDDRAHGSGSGGDREALLRLRATPETNECHPERSWRQSGERSEAQKDRQARRKAEEAGDVKLQVRKTGER